MPALQAEVSNKEQLLNLLINSGIVENLDELEIGSEIKEMGKDPEL